jgi:hypothetical protein
MHRAKNTLDTDDRRKRGSVTRFDLGTKTLRLILQPLSRDVNRIECGIPFLPLPPGETPVSPISIFFSISDSVWLFWQFRIQWWAFMLLVAILPDDLSATACVR